MIYKLLNASSILTVILLGTFLMTLIFNPEALRIFTEGIMLYIFIAVFGSIGIMASMNVKRKAREDQSVTKEDAVKSAAELGGLMLIMAFFGGMIF